MPDADESDTKDAAAASEVIAPADATPVADVPVEVSSASDVGPDVEPEAVAADTVNPAGASCKASCGKYKSGAPCQCDAGCGKFGDCCNDFQEACATCQGRCGQASDLYPCQCNAGCQATKSCCADQQQLCPCTTDCAGKNCGDDGCGGSCGACKGGETCTQLGQCKVVGAQPAPDVAVAETSASDTTASDTATIGDGETSDGFVAVADTKPADKPAPKDDGCSASRPRTGRGIAMLAAGLLCTVAVTLRRRAPKVTAPWSAGRTRAS
jgi:hypothetical protein